MSELILFYFFALVTLISGIMVISVKNPVHSVLFLILTFISAACLLFLLEIEFISLIFIVVYVGAIAVLFLFVVMMLDIKITDLNQFFFKYFPIGSFLGLTFLVEILLILMNLLEFNSYNFSTNPYTNWFKNVDYITNVESLGQILYTYYFPYFLIAGMILLVAMIGAIVLTLTFTRKARAQSIYKQVSRDFNNAIFIIDSKK